jgi:HlyD family secretion protein
MAVNGARNEEKAAAKGQVKAYEGKMQEVKAYRKETVQVAQMAGEVATIYPKVGELVGAGSPIMTISIMDDLWGTFNIREDQLQGIKKGDTFQAFVPAFSKEITMKVTSIKDQGSYATWKATKSNGQYDMKTFEVKARPTEKFDGLRPGMSVVKK